MLRIISNSLAKINLNGLFVLYCFKILFLMVNMIFTIRCYISVLPLQYEHISLVGSIKFMLYLPFGLPLMGLSAIVYIYIQYCQINCMATLEQILKEQFDYSQLSGQVSFTISDILNQPLDEIDFDDEDVYDDIFEDIVEQPQKQQTVVEAPIQPRLQRHRRLQDLPMVGMQQIKNMSYVALKNVSALFDTSSSKGVGIPTCICSTGSRFLAIGTSMGNIALFQVQVKGYKILKGTDDKKMGSVTSVSISRDNKYLIAGHETGLITLWDLYYYSLTKVQVMGTARVIKVLFCSQNHDFFIGNDSNGNVIMYSVQKYIWLNLKQQKLIDRTSYVYYDIKFTILISQTEVLALSCEDYVLVVSTFPKVGVIRKIERSEGVGSSKIPNCELGRCMFDGTLKDIVCISWGKKIYIYTFQEDYGDVNIAFLFTIDLGFTVFNLEQITDEILIILDENNTLRALNLEQAYKGDIGIINKNEVAQEIIYQRFIKDKNNKFIKNFSNTMVNCSYQSKKEIFFICKNSVYRGRLHRWWEYVQQVLEDSKNCLIPLKICLELYSSQKNIFAEKITLNRRTKDLFCEICTMFFNKKYKQLSLKTANFSKIKLSVQEVYDVMIQFSLRIQAPEYLFVKVPELIKSKQLQAEYGQYLIDCLEPFIMANMIPSIPDRIKFKEIISHFLQLKKVTLIDNLIIGLVPQSIFYEDTISLCTQKKLFKSLCHICSVSGDYISPLNKLLYEIKSSNQQNFKNAQTMYLQILTENLQSFLSGRYITDSLIPIDRYLVLLQNIQIWLTCSQTMSFLSVNHMNLYANYIQYLLSGLINSQYYVLINPLMEKIIKINKSTRISELIMEVSSRHQINQPLIEYVLDNYPQNYNIDLVNHFIFKFILLIKQQYSLKLNKILQLLSKDSLYLLQILQYPLKDRISYKDVSLPQSLSQFIIKYMDEQAIDSCLADLLHMNPDNTINYIIHHYTEELISDKLRKIQNSQQRFLAIRILLKTLRRQQKLSNYEMKRVQIEKDMMMFYMECLSQIKKEKRVYYELKTFHKDYPIMESLETVQKYGFKSCQAILRQLEGNLELAYRNYEIVYNHYFMINYNKIIRREYSTARFLYAIFQKMVQIANQQKSWMELLKSVLKPLELEVDQDIVAVNIQAIYQVEQSRNHPFIARLLEIIERTLTQVSRRISVQLITKQISSHSNLLSHKFIINSLTSTLQAFSRNIYIFQLSNQMIISDQVTQFNKLFTQYKVKGVRPTSRCMKCGVNFSIENQSELDILIETYPCGHTYHKSCQTQQDGQCDKCLKIELGQIGKINTAIDPKKVQYVENQQKEQSDLKNNAFKCLAYQSYIEEENNQFHKFMTRYETAISSQL